MYGYLRAPHAFSDRDNHLRNHRENPGTSAKPRAKLCPRTTGGSIHCGHSLIITWILLEVMQQDGASELFTVRTPPALPDVPHRSWLLTPGKPAAAGPHHTFKCHFTAWLKHLPCAPHSLLYCSAEVLLSVIHRVATLKTYKTSSKVELTALPSLVLENGTGHVLHNTSKIAFKPSNSYQSLIFHHIPPSKLIPAFRSLCLRTTYPFPTHPDQPLHSELTPNPSPNTLLLPDHSSQPFILLTQFLVSNLQIATAPQSDRNLVKPA